MHRQLTWAANLAKKLSPLFKRKTNYLIKYIEWHVKTKVWHAIFSFLVINKLWLLFCFIFLLYFGFVAKWGLILVREVLIGAADVVPGVRDVVLLTKRPVLALEGAFFIQILALSIYLSKFWHIEDFFWIYNFQKVYE